MKYEPAVNGLRVLPTQHTVADVLRRVQTLAQARGHGFPAELTKNIAALGNLAQAAAAADT